MTKYRIVDIASRTERKTRTDKFYPRWIGAVVEIPCELHVGDRALFRYIEDKNGEDGGGNIRTSTITAISEDDTELVVTTLNSVYCMEKVI